MNTLVTGRVRNFSAIMPGTKTIANKKTAKTPFHIKLLNISLEVGIGFMSAGTAGPSSWTKSLLSSAVSVLGTETGVFTTGFGATASVYEAPTPGFVTS